MRQRSPVRHGFSVVLQTPSLWAAELAWRWSFGFSAVLLSALSLFEFLHTLQVTEIDLLFLRSGNPFLMVEAVANIFQGCGPRLVRMAAVLGPGILILGTLAATVGRRVTLGSLVRTGRTSFRPLLGLNALRALLGLAGILSLGGAALLARAIAASVADSDHGMRVAMAFTLLLWVAIALMWGWLSWILSLAALATPPGASTFTAIADAVSAVRRERRGFAVINACFGLLHFGLLILASVVAISNIGTRSIFILLLIALLYFALVDLLHIARLAAYVSLFEGDSPTPSPTPLPAPPAGPEAVPIA